LRMPSDYRAETILICGGPGRWDKKQDLTEEFIFSS